MCRLLKGGRKLTGLKEKALGLHKKQLVEQQSEMLAKRLQQVTILATANVWGVDEYD